MADASGYGSWGGRTDGKVAARRARKEKVQRAPSRFDHLEQRLAEAEARLGGARAAALVEAGPAPEGEWQQAVIHEGDSLDLLRAMPSRSVDLILTDPPYMGVRPFREKGVRDGTAADDGSWDHQWETTDAFLSWMRDHAREWRRVLKYNGSILVFASPQMASRVEGVIRSEFEVLNHIVWAKPTGLHLRTSKAAQRSWFPCSERIIFAEQLYAEEIALGEDNYVRKCDELRGFVFEPLRAYLDGERARAGLTRGEVNRLTGTAMAGHWFGTSQWALPTRPAYEALRRIFADAHAARAAAAAAAEASEDAPLGRDYEALSRDYEALATEYDELVRQYEELRRPFRVEGTMSTDVWTYPVVQHFRGKHSCEKPLQMLEDVIRQTTRPGAVVFDGFCGSGSTALAALHTGRRVIAADKSPHWSAYARERVARLRALEPGQRLDPRRGVAAAPQVGHQVAPQPASQGLAVEHLEPQTAQKRAIKTTPLEKRARAPRVAPAAGRAAARAAACAQPDFWAQLGG